MFKPQQEAALKASRNLLAGKWELEEAESGFNAICKVLDFSLSTTRSMKSDWGSYKPPSSHKSLRLIQDNNNNRTPLSDVPADVNVHVHDNDKPPQKEPMQAQQFLCALGRKINELNPSVAPFIPS